jgi:hypothetical protein
MARGLQPVVGCPMSDVTVWIALFALGLVGLNWPILEIFRDSAFPYLLGVWLLLVILVASAARRGPAPPPR